MIFALLSKSIDLSDKVESDITSEIIKKKKKKKKKKAWQYSYLRQLVFLSC